MADELYFQTLGQAVWNFALLRWDVVYLIVRMNKDDWKKARLDQPSGRIAEAFRESIKTQGHLPPEFVDRLLVFAGHYEADITERNNILHVHPYTSASGEVQLGGESRAPVGSVSALIYREWPLDRLNALAVQFESHHQEGYSLLNEYVKKFLPQTSSNRGPT